MSSAPQGSEKMKVARLVTRAVTAGVIGARARPASFTQGVHTVLQREGLAVYYAQSGSSWSELSRVVRETLPDTAVVLLEYEPGLPGLIPQLRAVLRWKRAGRYVVLIGRPEPSGNVLQRLACAMLRRAVDLELTITDGPEQTLAGWPADRLPPPHRLAAGWRVRSERARIEEILDLLRCPRCRTPLRSADDGGLVCDGDHTFPIVDGIPILLPERIELEIEHHDHEHPAGDAYQSEAHDGWRELGFYKRDLVARLLRGSPVPAASLDVGCGDWGVHHSIAGAIGRDLAVAGDISLELVRHARGAATAPGRIHHMVFSAEALPFRDGVFDLTYCSEVLEHLHHPENALAEMQRTSNGGRVILTIPNEKVTGKLEDGHVQTFGYDTFRALAARYVDIRRILGVYLWIEGNVDRLATGRLGRARMALYLRLGERLPRRSVNVVVDGSFKL